MDPIKLIIDLVLGGGGIFVKFYGGEPVIAGGILVGVVSLLLWIKFKPKDEDAYWSAVCVTAINRIEDLLPLYQMATQEYCDQLVSQIQQDKALCTLGTNTPNKFMAERDFERYDMKSNERIVALLSQLKFLKENPIKDV